MIEHYRETLRRVQLSPETWLVDDTLTSHIAFALAMDAGAGGNLLVGFHEFLVGKIGKPTTWWWPGLALWLTEPVGPKGRGIEKLEDARNRAAIARWYELLDECLALRLNDRGLATIFARYVAVAGMSNLDTEPTG